MKKILICTRDLSTGGVQKSLINLLNSLKNDIIKKNIIIDLLVLNKSGDLLREIPQCVNVIEANNAFLPFGTTFKESKKLGLKFLLKRSLYATFSKFFSCNPILKKCLKKQQVIGRYDTVISYAVSLSNKSLYVGWSEIALEKTISNNKIVYIHNDFLNSNLNNAYTLSIIKKFNKILFVSESCKKNFCSNFPNLSNKCDYLYNIINYNEILEKAKLEKIEFTSNYINLISVCRLSPEKGLERILNVLKSISAFGIKFKYHILGDGPSKNTLIKLTKTLKLEENVIFYGNISNPYPYMLSSDLYISASYNESFGLSMIESLILHTPVLTTENISSKEIIGDYGVICDNTETSLFNSLVSLLSNNAYNLKCLRSKSTFYKFNNNLTIDKFNTII